MKELQNRAIKAARKFIERRGLEIIDDEPEGIENGFVAREDGTVVFVEVSAASSIEAGFPREGAGEETRRRRERQAASWLSRFDGADTSIRFDNIAVLVVSEDRALLRHHINCLSVG